MPRNPTRARSFGPPDILAAKPRDSMSEWLEDCLSRLPDLEIRRMFSGAGIYSEQTMFGILAASRVYLKIDDATRGAFEERGMGPFQTRRGLALKSYYEVPPDVLDDETTLLEWSRRALEAARTAPAKSSRKPRDSAKARTKTSNAPTQSAKTRSKQGVRGNVPASVATHERAKSARRANAARKPKGPRKG